MAALRSKDELLKLVLSEAARAIGYTNNAQLIEDRTRALEYYKGDMRDLVVMKNRSDAVSYDVRDGIQAVLPDLVEIFAGSEDVATFRPSSAEDEEAAKQETDYVLHTIFEQNDGWSLFVTWILDALQAKNGVVRYWAEEGEPAEDQTLAGKTAAEIQMALDSGAELVSIKACEEYEEPYGAPSEPLWDAVIRGEPEDGRVCIANVPPEDVAVAADTISLRDATYVSVRSRPRVQDLVASGIPKDLLDKVPSWGGYSSQESLARDTVAETALSKRSTDDMLRQIEVYEHYIRLKSGRKSELWCVTTAGRETGAALLRHEKVSQIGLAAITPYRVPHRFFGQSLADFLVDIQRLKSQFQRMQVDSGLFALNQRHVVNIDRLAEGVGLDDYLNNQPGVPIRVTDDNAVVPLASAGLSFDPLQSLEYFSTVAEERTGIVRASQGLNPDTLHETLGGAMQQLSRAQKRIRMIAKTFAETGVRDLYLGIHALLRENQSKERVVRLRGKWVPVNPSKWVERSDMQIEIGMGSGGREFELATIQQVIALQEKAVQAQGGMSGPLVTTKELYNSAIRLSEKAGLKAPEQFFANPEEQASQEQAPQEQGPEQAKMQLEQAKLQSTIQIEQMRIESQERIEAAKLQEQQRQFDEELSTKISLAQAEIAIGRNIDNVAMGGQAG
jgi:hypothetical protein